MLLIAILSARIAVKGAKSFVLKAESNLRMKQWVEMIRTQIKNSTGRYMTVPKSILLNKDFWKVYKTIRCQLN